MNWMVCLILNEMDMNRQHDACVTLTFDITCDLYIIQALHDAVVGAPGVTIKKVCISGLAF